MLQARSLTTAQSVLRPACSLTTAQSVLRSCLNNVDRVGCERGPGRREIMIRLAFLMTVILIFLIPLLVTDIAFTFAAHVCFLYSV
jgi:hypothetical protein